MYMGWLVLGIVKHMEQSHLCQSLVSACAFEVAVGKLKRYKLPGV
jgi:hypothetical protein